MQLFFVQVIAKTVFVKGLGHMRVRHLPGIVFAGPVVGFLDYSHDLSEAERQLVLVGGVFLPVFNDGDHPFGREGQQFFFRTHPRNKLGVKLDCLIAAGHFPSSEVIRRCFFGERL